MAIVIAADHAAVELKAELVPYLKGFGFDVVDLGGFDPQAKDSPAEFADKVAHEVLSGRAVWGVLMCGTGIGVCMRANRYQGIRAALVHDDFTAEMAKKHSNANVLCMGSRVISVEQAKRCIDQFVQNEFEGGRHIPRLEMLDLPAEKPVVKKK